MASKRLSTPARRLLSGSCVQQDVPAPHRIYCRGIATATSADPPTHIHAQLNARPGQPSARAQSDISSYRSLSTQAQPHKGVQGFQAQPNPFLATATCTTYAFPEFEPVSTVTYPGTHLLVPLRKDILHRAVIFEGDATRQGTASTKWRSEVHGSNRKIRPQKGSGMARLGDKKSPMLVGGGVAFGPKPRDFSTDLPRKVYDLAWRTALSYRYRKGELIVTEDLADVDCAEASRERYFRELLRRNRMGRPDGRTLFVAGARRESLFAALEEKGMDTEARALEVDDVDVKDLLELGRVVIERAALEAILRERQADLAPAQRLGAGQRS